MTAGSEGNTLTLNGQDQLLIWGAFKAIPSGCWMPHPATNANKSSHVHMTELAAVIPVSSPQEQPDRKWDCGRYNYVSRNP